MYRQPLKAMLIITLLAPAGAMAGPHYRDGAFCGTADIVRAVQHEDLMGRGLPRATDAARAEDDCWENLRPTYPNEETLIDNTYGFTIHYTTDSSDDAAVSEGDAQQVAAVMREVIGIEQNDLGYQPPPDDSIDADYYCDDGFGGNGGSGNFDIYFIADDTLYGYAQPLTDLDDSSGAATSYLALSTWILDYEGALEVTVAHEYFHSVQFAYDSYEDAAWMETSATWMEEQAYDDVNDYLNYLEDAFDAPSDPLDTFDNSGVIQYGNVIWPLFLTQTLPASYVREVWEGCSDERGENALAAQKALLDVQYDGGFAGAILDFRAAMYDLSQFEEGESYPAVYLAEEDAIDGGGRLSYTGADFISLLPGEAGEPLSVCFEADEDATSARLFRGAVADRSLLGTLRSGDLLDISDYATDELVLVVANGDISGVTSYGYATSIDEECDPPGGCGRCDTGRSAPAHGLAWALGALALIAVRRRR